MEKIQNHNTMSRTRVGCNNIYFGRNRFDIFSNICERIKSFCDYDKEIIVIDTEGDIAKNLRSENFPLFETEHIINLNSNAFVTVFPSYLDKYSNIDWDNLDLNELKYDLSGEYSKALTAIVEAATGKECNSYEYGALCEICNDIINEWYANEGYKGTDEETDEYYRNFNVSNLLEFMSDKNTPEVNKIIASLRPYFCSFANNISIFTVSHVDKEKDRIYPVLKCIDLSNIHEKEKSYAVQCVLSFLLSEVNLKILNNSNTHFDLFIPFEKHLFKTETQVCNLLTVFKRIRENIGSASIYTTCLNDLVSTPCGTEFLNCTDGYCVSMPFSIDTKLINGDYRPM